jgi:hypothetical protein
MNQVTLAMADMVTVILGTLPVDLLPPVRRLVEDHLVNIFLRVAPENRQNLSIGDIEAKGSR